MPVTVTVAACAHELGVTPAAVRAWLRQGAPAASEGSPGRGRGARVVLADIMAWRARRAGLADTGGAAVLGHIAAALLEVFQRDAGRGEPLHKSIGVPAPKAAALLVAAYQRVHRRITGSDPDQLPADIESIFSVCIRSAATQHGDGSCEQ